MLAFNVGGLPEVVLDKDLLLEYRDVEGLVDKTIGILEEPRAFYEKAVRLYNEVRGRFSLSGMIHNYVKLYYRVLKHG